MAKTKHNRIRLSDRYSLEGTPFDWRLIRHDTAEHKGKVIETEKCHYFPRLCQITQHIVDNDAKEAETLATLIDTINSSTDAILSVLGGMGSAQQQEAFDRALSTHRTEVTGDSDDSDSKTDEQPAETEAEPEPAQRAEPPARKRRRRKKAG